MILDQSEEERRLTLYKKGFSDKQIANILDISRRGVCRWRQRRNLPLNENSRLYLDKAEDRRREILYKKGFSDREIAKKLKLNKAAIRGWRERRGKSLNFPYHPPINPKLEMSNVLAYTLGVMYGDGCFVKGCYRLDLGVKEKTLATSFTQALKELGLRPFMYYNNGRWTVVAYSKVFYIAFSQPNFLELYDKLIENKNFAWSFLRGAYEAEGSVSLRGKGCAILVEIFCNQNQEFFELVKNLCIFCNIHYTKIYEEKRRNGILKRLFFKGPTFEALSFLQELNPAVKNATYALHLLRHRISNGCNKSVNRRVVKEFSKLFS